MGVRKEVVLEVGCKEGRLEGSNACWRGETGPIGSKECDEVNGGRPGWPMSEGPSCDRKISACLPISARRLKTSLWTELSESGTMTSNWLDNSLLHFEGG